MSISRTTLLALLTLSVLVAPIDGAAAATPHATDAGAAGDMVDSPPDPDEDVQGWENGYWHNETLSNVTPDDGYTDAEIEKVRARSMARIEVVRGIEFEETPPVRVISREEYVSNVRERREGVNVSTNARLHQNAKFEAMLMVGEGTDYFDEQQQLQSSTVAGFYVLENANASETIEPGEIVLVSENAETPQLSEITLAQELFHSYQDKQLRIDGRYNRTTEEDARRIDAVIEGDGNYVDYRYEQRCGSEWTCFQPSSGSGGNEGGSATRPNLGLLVYSFVQYSEGPAWVQSLYQEGGWEAVDRTYANPPQSTEQYIHHEKYLQDPPTNVTVTDRSNEEWYVPQLEGGVNYATFGEAGMYSMLWYASPAVPRNDILTQRQLDPYDYAHPASAGWNGDKLYPYVTDESNETGEMGYVWKSAWDTPGDAREFAEAYRAALEGTGEPVEGRANTWRLPESHPFDDAFYVAVNGSTVVIVNAPTVAELSEVRSGAAPTVATPTPTPGADGTDTATESAETDGTETPTVTESTSPGFGVGVAVAALLAVALLFRRR